MKMPYPLPKYTRQKAQSLMLSLIDNNRLLTDYERAGLLRYLAPPLPPKQAKTGIDYVSKTGNPVHVKRGVAYSGNKDYMLQANVTDMPDGLYDGKTLLPVDYSGELKSVNFDGAGVPVVVNAKTPKVIVADGIKFKAKSYEIVVNKSTPTNLRLLYKQNGELIGLAGDCDVGKFIVRPLV